MPVHNIRIQIPHDADDDSGEEDVEEEDQEDVPGLRCSWLRGCLVAYSFRALVYCFVCAHTRVCDCV